MAIPSRYFIDLTQPEIAAQLKRNPLVILPAGSVEQHEVADEDAGADDRHTTLPGEDGDGGHDHMPSLSAGLSAMVASAPVLAAPPVTRVEHASPTVLVPPDNIRLPHIRPPRAA